MQAEVRDGITLEYDTFGDPDDPPAAAGHGARLPADPLGPGLLPAAGRPRLPRDPLRQPRRRACRPRSAAAPKPNVGAALAGFTGSASYTLWDMADDTAGAARPPRSCPAAHVAGISMGGMIAQSLAINHPDRVLSLASLLSTTGNRRVGVPRMRALALLLQRARPRTATPTSSSRVEAQQGDRQRASTSTRSACASCRGAAYDRCYYPVGMLRQLVGIQASGDRTEQLKRPGRAHGGHPRVATTRWCPPARATPPPKAIPGARMVEIADLAHDLPPRGLGPGSRGDRGEHAALPASTAARQAA